MSTPTSSHTAAGTSLVGLLGDSRARLVELLRAEPRSVAALAREIGLSEVAVRHHLQVLEGDGFVAGETVRRSGRGRPGMQYALTDRAQRLFPDNSSELANELMDYLGDEHGRAELLRFLRWRAGRHSERYAEALAGADSVEERAERLAGALSEDGFASSVETVTTPEGATMLELRQGHCAIQSVAEEHPELCAFEASTFKQLLGTKLSRRQTIAGGADACVCHITVESSKE